MKAEFDPKNVKKHPEYCMLYGWALALAHAKSGGPAAIAGDEEGFLLFGACTPL